MKRLLLVLYCCLAGTTLSAQVFSASLTGNPLNTSGWISATGISYVSGNEFVLTDPVGTSAGYIYYGTPQDLTVCSKFTVSFEFRISNSSSPTADGITFWYVSNPPTGFTNGGGLGLPNNPNGLVLLFDTYDNNSTPDNPIIALRSFNGTQNYIEGSTSGRLGADLFNQSWVRDGSWHQCSLVYDNGVISIYFDGQATPSIAAFYPLKHTGYFGFSASTGALWARHSIREVYIDGAPMPAPPVVLSPITYCQYDSAVVLTATGIDLNWYTSDTAGTPLAAAPVPLTDVAGVKTWYVSQGSGACESPRDSIQVIVHARPSPPDIDFRPAYCEGETFVPVNTYGQLLTWYEADSGGTGTASAPMISTAVPATYTWFVSRTVNGCEGDRKEVTIKVYEGASAGYEYTMEPGCSKDVLSFVNTSKKAHAYQWSFGDGLGSTAQDPVHVYTKQGTYDVKLIAYAAERCMDSVISMIDTRHEVFPLELQVTADTTIPYGNSIRLFATGASYYSWSPPGSLDAPDSDRPVATPLEPVVYTVSGLDEEGCRGTAQVRIDIDYSMHEVVPNAFTPDGDGRNDKFRLLNIRYQKISEFMIFNRWGQEVFSTTDPQDGWDGTFNGQPQPSGTYYYVARLTYPDGSIKAIRGNMLLVR